MKELYDHRRNDTLIYPEKTRQSVFSTQCIKCQVRCDENGCKLCRYNKQSRPYSKDKECVCLNFPTKKEQQTGKCMYYYRKEDYNK